LSRTEGRDACPDFASGESLMADHHPSGFASGESLMADHHPSVWRLGYARFYDHLLLYYKNKASISEDYYIILDKINSMSAFLFKKCL